MPEVISLFPLLLGVLLGVVLSDTSIVKSLKRSVKGLTRGRLLTYLITSGLVSLPALGAHAQGEIGIEFGAEDLNVFFDWFNTIFEALLPIGLLAAGLTAGGLFVWVISKMLVNAFRSMTGASG